MASIEKPQLAILEALYQGTDIPMTSYFDRSDIVQGVAEELEEVSESEVQVGLRDLEDRGLVRRDGRLIQISPSGLERIDEEIETELEDELQNDILHDLAEQETQDPDHPALYLDNIGERYGLPESAIAENLFVMTHRGLIRLESINQTYRAEIDARGRDQL